MVLTGHFLVPGEELRPSLQRDRILHIPLAQDISRANQANRVAWDQLFNAGQQGNNATQPLPR